MITVLIMEAKTVLPELPHIHSLITREPVSVSTKASNQLSYLHNIDKIFACFKCCLCSFGFPLQKLGKDSGQSVLSG